MDYTTIINTFFDYSSMILFLLAALVFADNLLL